MDTCQPLLEACRAGNCSLVASARGHHLGRRLPPSVLPGLRSVGCWDATLPHAWHLDWHRDEGLEITFLERGNLPFATEDSQTLLVRASSR